MRTFARWFFSANLAALLLAESLAAMPPQPNLELTTLDGEHFSLTAQRGRWVLINDWATWCVPCIAEMPVLSAFARGHSGKVVVVGLAYDDTDEVDIRQFLRQHRVSYPIARVGLDHPPADFDEPKGLPMSWLIAPDGRVAKRFLGPVKRAQLEAAISGGS